ncbi:alpha/beta fold hydrolase [Autumnicola edwardsiae]|uniref:Alpha/beta hydrolase n=1 Tax=Autumnicola edwardsiae TaxID=3075594 RepID=A0ABU3CYQ0_9FLAO|nr:alpha/beta hydrolase [Zunongwangia sp. F297]MDT0651500.1 alpha/beta hydrolase [Zunongwangia sp. F297]
MNNGYLAHLFFNNMKKKNKENIPVQRLLVPGYILQFNQLLTKLSPHLASRFAARLFLTPFRYKLPEREKKMDNESIQEQITIPQTHREIVTYKYGESSKRILLVHGWSGRGTQLSKIAEALLENGYSTISFDAPAHGKAPGSTSMMPYFTESIHHLNKFYGPFEAIIGHSLGGMSALKAISEGASTKKLVLLGTANSITHITKEFARNMKMNDKVAGKMKAYLDNKFKQDMDSYSGAVSAEGVTTPTLVIHDKNDVDVAVSCAYDIDEKLKNSELFITEGLGHRRILGNPEVINKIATFITV